MVVWEELKEFEVAMVAGSGSADLRRTPMWLYFGPISDSRSSEMFVLNTARTRKWLHMYF